MNSQATQVSVVNSSSNRVSLCLSFPAKLASRFTPGLRPEK
jgi:hypothetical protein